jgi:hypothetical protein
MNRYGKGRFNGPIFKLQPRSFDFNEDRANDEEVYLKTKFDEIGVPGSGSVRRQFYEKNLFAKQKKPTVENEYLKHSLQTNPYFVIDQSEQIIHEQKDKKDLIDELKGMNQNLESDDEDGKEKPVNHEPSQPTSSHNQDFFEKFDLQSTKVKILFFVGKKRKKKIFFGLKIGNFLP